MVGVGIEEESPPNLRVKERNLPFPWQMRGIKMSFKNI